MCLSMCGCAYGNPARSPTPATIFETLNQVMGPPRSDANTNAPVDWRRSSRKARELVALDRMHRRDPTFQASDVEVGAIEVDLELHSRSTASLTRNGSPRP